MKKIALILSGALALTTVCFAQAPAGTPAKDDKQQQAAKPTEPVGGTKTAPVAKTKEEQDAVNAVLSKTADPAAMQAAADDFSTKFPDSNVRGMIYRSVMLAYEQQGNADKAYEAGRKALTFDPDDPLTLSECAMYLASHTRDSDLDKNERLTDVRKMANESIANMDQLRMSNKASEADRANAQKFVKGTDYAALAIAAQVDKDWATAETNYQKSVDSNPDASMMLRLGFAQRMQNKLQAASATFDKAIDLGTKQQQPAVVQFATQQKESVQKQLSKPAAPAAPAAPATPKQ